MTDGDRRNQALTPSAADDRADGPTRDGSADAPPADRLQALCDRVSQLAMAVSDESIAAAQEKAEALVADATAQAKAEHNRRVDQVREQLERRKNRELQNERLAAGARIENCRWDELTAVLDEAEQTVAALRDIDPDRYDSALLGWVRSAREQLPSQEIVVRLNPADADAVRQRLTEMGGNIELVEQDIPAGVIVSTADGNVVVDHSLARRRQRMEFELRRAAVEVLFQTSEVA